MADEKLQGAELKKKFLSLLSKNSYRLWDEDDTLKSVEQLSLDKKEVEKMEKGFKDFASHRSETDKVIFFKIKKAAFLFFPDCSVQSQGAVMVSELAEINP